MGCCSEMVLTVINKETAIRPANSKGEGRKVSNTRWDYGESTKGGYIGVPMKIRFIILVRYILLILSSGYDKNYINSSCSLGTVKPVLRLQ
jgi:hypothetical protein